MKQKIICLDYDGTYTDFPELMDTIITRSKYLGYKVILATMRYPDEEDDGIKKLREKLDGVYFTDRCAKREYLAEHYSIFPDIWIDDNPAWIIMNSGEMNKTKG